jgi:hypothetical protein
MGLTRGAAVVPNPGNPGSQRADLRHSRRNDLFNHNV